MEFEGRSEKIATGIDPGMPRVLGADFNFPQISFPMKIYRICALAVASAFLANTPAFSAHQHPFLFFSGDQLPEFRRKVESVECSREAYHSLKRTVDKAPAIQLPPPNSQIRTEWLPAVRKFPRLAAYAAFLYLLDEDEKYLDYAREYLLTYAGGFDQRLNFHNIDQKDGIVIYDTGTLGVYSAWTYDMIYHQLSEDERELIESKLLRGIVEMIRHTTETVSIQDQWAGLTEDSGKRPKDYDWGPGQWNGNMYCNTGLAAIGFTLEDAPLIEHTVNNWKVYLARDMLADGMWQEEDFAYSRFCYSSMLTLAEMAYQYGYPEDLYHWEVVRKPNSQWDPGYVDAPFIDAEGEDSGLRSMKMFLDAQIDYQYPDLGPGNWGWQTNSASFLDKSAHVTFYELGYLRYQDPVYGWILNQMDRSRGNGYAQGSVSPILYGSDDIENVEKPATASRWYNHSKWITLKSIEGRDYWDSDSLYAFMPYGGERTKAIKPLSVDLFAFGKVVAPRVAKVSRLQSHDKDYYLTEDSWNAYLVDGTNLSILRDMFSRTRMRFHEFSPELKIVQAAIELERAIRPSFWYEEVAVRSPELDRTDSRLLAMSGEYLIDILDIRYLQEQAYKHHFEWVWHAFGDLTLESAEEGEVTFDDWSATWHDSSDDVGLKTYMLGSRTGGTKVTRARNRFGDYVKAFRGNYGESFVAVHEPFRGQPAIDTVSELSRSDGSIALKIVDQGGYTDYHCLAFAADSCAFEKDGESMSTDGYYGYLRVNGDRIVGRGAIDSFRIYAPQVERVELNGEDVQVEYSDGYVIF